MEIRYLSKTTGWNYIKMDGSENLGVAFQKWENEKTTRFEIKYKPSLDVEVYAGDLIEVESSVSGKKKKKIRLAKIMTSQEGMSVAIWYKKEWWAYSSINWTTVKVVGNIHENANLLNL